MITSHPAKSDPIGSRVRPADECPWPRPFPEGFDACPAYLEQRFIPLDINDQPLSPVRTCRHLVSRRLPDRTAGWYAACQVGDAAARQRWFVASDGDGHQVLGTLRARMEAINRPFVQRIWAAKAQQRAAAENGAPVKRAADELRLAGADFVLECATFLSLHRQEFEQAGLGPGTILLVLPRTGEPFGGRDGGELGWDGPEHHS